MEQVAGVSAERRQHVRVPQTQFYLGVGGHTYRKFEWSYGGFLIEDKVGRLATGALLWIDGLVSEDDYRRCATPHLVDIRARVVRIDPLTHAVALSCLKIDDAGYAIMSGSDAPPPKVAVPVE